MRLLPLAGLVCVLVLGACGRYSPGPSAQAVPPLTPVPTTSVQAQALPPPVPVEPTVAPVETPVDPVAQQQAALEISRPALVGAWKLASGGENCQLFINLTSWTGGYRANTRGCASDELKAIGAWDLSGKEVVLKDASGSPVATLYANAPQRFSGQTAVGGRGIQFFR